MPSRAARSPRGRGQPPALLVTVDLPHSVPVTSRELEVLERSLGAVLDALLGS